MNTNERILELLSQTSRFMSIEELARELDLSRSHVRDCCRKLYWSASRSGVGVLQRRFMAGRKGRRVEYLCSTAGRGGEDRPGRR